MKKWGKKGGEITRLDTYVCVSVLAKKWGEYKKDGERERERERSFAFLRQWREASSTSCSEAMGTTIGISRDSTHKRRGTGGKKKTWCKKRISCNDKAVEQQNNQEHPSAWWKSEILSSKTRYWKVFMGI